MSKMIELATEFQRARRDFLDYQREAQKAALTFRLALISHLGAEDEQVRFMSLQEDRDEEKKYTVRGAMYDDAEGWLHVGFLLTIYELAESYPHDKTIFPVLMRKAQGTWVFLLEPNGRQFKIEKHDQQASYQELCEEIFVAMKTSYVDALKIFLHEKPKTTLGFMLHDFSEE